MTARVSTSPAPRPIFTRTRTWDCSACASELSLRREVWTSAVSRAVAPRSRSRSRWGSARASSAPRRTTPGPLPSRQMSSPSLGGKGVDPNATRCETGVVRSSRKGGEFSMLTSLYLRLRSLFNREEGQGMVEYALILVLIAVVVIVVLIVLGNQVKNVFCNISGGLGQ